MKAVVEHAPFDFRVEEVKKPAAELFRQLKHEKTEKLIA